jgi:glycerate dehydrogenase
MRIVVLDGYTLNPGDNPWSPLESLGEFTVYDRTSGDEFSERCAGAEVIITNKVVLSADRINELPQLKMIAVTATGYNVVDIEAARARGIPVCNVPVYGTNTVAQHVFAVLLTMCHQPILHDQAVRDGEWFQQQGDFCFWKVPLIELVGKTMGIVGFGRIGRRTGELAHAFGMNVIAQDVVQGESPGYEPFAWRSLEEVFEEADVVSLHCPQTEDNAGFVNRSLLSKMKPTAILINAARGGIYVEQDLADALNDGTIAGACLDVFASEPIDQNSPLLNVKNLLLTPHIAWATLEARQRIMQTTAENIAAFQQGNPANVVNG